MEKGAALVVVYLLGLGDFFARPRADALCKGFND